MTEQQRPRAAAIRAADGLAEQRFRSYFELGLVGMAMTSPTKGCIQVNDEICRILALTGYGQPSDRQRALRAGFSDHLVKPIDIERLLAILEA